LTGIAKGGEEEKGSKIDERTGRFSGGPKAAMKRIETTGA
jgi:hypothetical protein